jgi:hypothetical protein
MKSKDVTGDNIINSKNVKNSFGILGNVEDSKYIIHGMDVKDGYDAYGGGGVASLLYEGVDTGLQGSEQLFSVLNHTCLQTYYTYMCYNSKNLFGCVSLRGKQYCILNKQYTKEEYFELVPKIIEQMNTTPYKDKKGLMRLARKGQEIENYENLIKDPYVLEFTGLSPLPKLYENKLERSLVDNLSRFLLELGKGFTFLARQKRITLDGDHFFIDLVFLLLIFLNIDNLFLKLLNFLVLFN